MKKTTTLLMAICLIFSAKVSAQLFNFTISPGSSCFSSSNNTLLAGMTATLPGANNYSWTVVSASCNPATSVLVNNPTQAVLSLTVSCASTHTIILSGYNNSTFISSVSQSFQMLPSPNITLSQSSGTVCLGSAITFSANGGMTYTWTPASVGATLNVIPLSSSTYTVMGSHALNSCIGWAIATVSVNPSCAKVWPGDANHDGVVNTADVLELGLWSGSTGPARTPASIAWSGQQASAWTGSISTGWNRAHADCNGDGTINAGDNGAITANFSFTHAFKPTAAAGNDIKLVPQQAMANAGQWNKADIVLGDATNNISQLYGVAFDLNYNQAMVQNDSVKIIYTSSFLKGSNQTIDFGKTIYANGKLYAAIVRTDQTNVNGNGKIGELWYWIKSGLAPGSSINLSASNALMISSAGITSTLGAAPAVNLAIELNPVGINNYTKQIFSMSPNPVSQTLFIRSSSEQSVNYTVLDISGRAVMSGSFSGNTQLDVSALTNGTYLVKLVSDNSVSHQKIIVSR